MSEIPPANSPDQNTKNMVLAIMILFLAGVLIAGFLTIPHQSYREPDLTDISPALTAVRGIDAVLPLPSEFTHAYKIQKMEDVSFGGVSRFVLRITVQPGLSRSELETNLKHAVRVVYDSRHPDAIEVFAYRDGEPATGVYSVAHCTFAPGGQWERANEKRPIEDYRVVIETNSDYFRAQTPSVPLGSAATPEPRTTREMVNGFSITILHYIPEDRRRAIFYDLVKNQDAGIDDEKAYDVTAAKFHVSRDEVSTIGSEGVARHWPMP